MQNMFIIHGKLPSLNEYVDECRRNRYSSNKYKKNIELFIKAEIHNAKVRKTLSALNQPVFVVFEWHEKTKRRDSDNIAFAKKFILDAMQSAGIIPNDNRKYVKGFSDVIVDDKDDFVIVKILNYQEKAKNAAELTKGIETAYNTKLNKYVAQGVEISVKLAMLLLREAIHETEVMNMLSEAP